MLSLGLGKEFLQFCVFLLNFKVINQTLGGV
jgi:hypothetical protein